MPSLPHWRKTLKLEVDFTGDRAGPGLGLREWGLIFHCLHLCVIFFFFYHVHL